MITLRRCLFCGIAALLATVAMAANDVQIGATNTAEYLPMLMGKRVGLVAHGASRVGNSHLLDVLTAHLVHVVKIFAPEHGYRGNAEAGAHIADEVDSRTNIPVISIYGAGKKPTPQHLQGVDVMLFDLQDVGVRCYTYLSTLHYVMEACAENNIPLIVLDRPNPNGHYVDGPVLRPQYRSFVGMHPIPMVHGMTLGELAQMINGEGWLQDDVQCRLTVIKCRHYTHATPYKLPVPPSPNLPNQRAVYLYPSLCFFEGTIMSVGRGTDYPFQVMGHPDWKVEDFTFVPRSIGGVAEHPPFEGKMCYGVSLSRLHSNDLYYQRQINLQYLIDAHRFFGKRLFNSFFTKLAGTDRLQKQIERGLSVDKIRASWYKEHQLFLTKRTKYLLYN